MTITDKLKTGRLYCDGGMGTLLQQAGLPAGDSPESWNITHPEIITALHRDYLEAGADIINANTFGVNSLKFDNPEKYIQSAFECAKNAIDGFEDKYIAFDMGPLGKMLEPFGDMPFEDAVSVFAENARLAEKYGFDLVMIETMNDCAETRAALLAVKENCSLPVFVTNVYDERGKLMTGACAHAMIAMLEGMGADAIGLNCSLGPDKMIPVIEEYVKYSSLPIIVNPNAGMPEIRDGKTVFPLGADEFSETMSDIAKMGVGILGGCCGTTPLHIKALYSKTKGIPYTYPEKKNYTAVSSYTTAVTFGDKPVLIGERINPTGKKLIKEALREKNYTYILTEGVRQADKGADMLDVNAGLPEIDECEALCRIIKELQAVCDKPLQIDTTNVKALESSMRAYIGKPLVNSVNGTKESMDSVFPLVKKYGGTVIALTIGKSGIPDSAEGRLEVARDIIEYAETFGIDKKDIIVDPLALSVSSDPKSAKVTLDSIRLIKETLGVCTSLGVSNISFGLPDRDAVNSAFFTMAMQAGLDGAIMNPFSDGMMKAYYSYCALCEKDKNLENYITFATGNVKTDSVVNADMTLCDIIYKGLDATAKTEQMLDTVHPLEIINSEIIPALEKIGTDFEQKRAFLPQLLMSASSATGAFEVIRKKMPSKAQQDKKIVIATVKGDIHDIGKNIVKVLLENFGFSVTDLGRDVDPKIIAEASKGCKLTGLSALMTTTVPAMEETIKLIRKVSPETKIMVGGAVLTQKYADMIGADFYGKDAMESVRIAQKVFETADKGAHRE